ncbi:uncharacterized protein C1orf87 homolog [Pelodytes ibericus]
MITKRIKSLLTSSTSSTFERLAPEFLRMSHAKRFPPGNDAMPKIIVKIVGSKYVKFFADPADSSTIQSEEIENNMSQIAKEFGGVGYTESLTQSLLERDPTLRGIVSSKEFQAVCDSHGVSLSSSLLQSLLKDPNYSNGGNIRWQMFIDLLQRVKNESRHRQGIVHINLYWKDPLDNQPCDGCSLPLVGIQCCSPRDTRPISEPALRLSKDRHSADPETWIDRFKKLENVLHLCEIGNSGLVEMERAKKLIYNYNLIYRLSLSTAKIEEALRTLGSGPNIPVEPLLLYLKEL